MHYDVTKESIFQYYPMWCHNGIPPSKMSQRLNIPHYDARRESIIQYSSMWCDKGTHSPIWHQDPELTLLLREMRSADSRMDTFLDVCSVRSISNPLVNRFLRAMYPALSFIRASSVSESPLAYSWLRWRSKAREESGQWGHFHGHWSESLTENKMSLTSPHH